MVLAARSYLEPGANWFARQNTHCRGIMTSGSRSLYGLFNPIGWGRGSLGRGGDGAGIANCIIEEPQRSKVCGPMERIVSMKCFRLAWVG